MSGGVDSTSCALLLQKDHNVTGFFMQLAQPDIEVQLQRVQQVAKQLQINLKIIDLQAQFKQRVLDYFSSSYFSGLTPNPCVICNKEIKFGLFMDTILKSGMDLVATGHYAQVDKVENIYQLLKGKDRFKDQSYFLSRLSQEQLSRILFPLGNKKKEEIYTFVESYGFTHFRGQESQDICFLGEKKVGTYLETCLPLSEATGPIVNTAGQTLGQHRGLFRYTIGQRRGLGLPDSTPWYVVEIRPETDTLVVGKEEELFRNTIDIHHLHWVSGYQPDLDRDYQVRIRYSHQGSIARLTKTVEDQCRITFSSQQRAITPGQFAVIYDHDQVIGSGEIM